MAIFLNTEKLNYWIPKLIEETQKELVIIVPYIKTSDKVYQPLKEANKRGVETTLVYRENKLSDLEKAKFQALDNINLLHHPNIHCKCFYNEKYLIITSMNMYEYSEKNNREMGVLLHRNQLEQEKINPDDAKLFEDAIKEINAIINGATLEKKSRETIELGFEMDIIKSAKEKAQEKCSLLNKAFIHKRFEPLIINENWICQCDNYFDKVQLIISHRVELKLTLPESQIENIYNNFKRNLDEFLIDGFKLYWSYYKSDIYLYQNSKHSLWSKPKGKLEEYKLIKVGIDQLIIELRQSFKAANNH